MVACSFQFRFGTPILAGTKAHSTRAERKRHGRLSTMAQRHSHHGMCGQWLLKAGAFVMPSGVPCIQPRMLADVHGRHKPEQQQKRQGHGVGMPARSMDTNAAQREQGREGQWYKRFARHREHRRSCRSRFFACRLALEGGTKLHGVDAQGRPEHPDPRWQPLAPPDALDTAGAA